MSRRQVAALALVLCVVVPATALAKDVVELIPGDSYGYVVINRLAELDGKIQAMGQRMELPIPSVMSLVKARSGIAEGVDQLGSMALTFVPTSQGPSAVLYIPVDDYAAFIEQLEPEGTENNITTGRLAGRTVIVGEKNGYAVIAWPTDRQLLRKILSDEATGQGTTGVAKALVADHDVAAVLSSSGVNALTALGQKGLEAAKAVVQEQVDEESPVLAGIEVYVHLLNALNSEIASAAVGLKLEEGGSLRISELVWVQPAGKMAPLLRDAKPYEGDLLAGLPKIPYVIAVGGVIPRDAMEPMMDFSGNMMKSMPQLYGLTPEQVDKMMELSAKYFSDLRSMSFLLGVGQGDAPLYSEMLGVMRVRDAQAYMTNYRKYWVELDEVVGDAEDSFLNDVEVEDVMVDGVSVLKITMPIPGFQVSNLPNQGDIDALMEKLYGPGGITIYLAAANDDTVVMAYTDMALLRKAFQATSDHTKQFSQEKNIVSTSKLLPSGAHAIGYWSPSGTMAFANRMVHLMSGSDASVQLPDFPDTPPLGWTMKATPSVVKFDTVLPAATIEAAGSFIEQVKQLNRAEDAEQN